MQNALAGQAQGVSGNRNQQGERIQQHPALGLRGEASLLLFASRLKERVHHTAARICFVNHKTCYSV